MSDVDTMNAILKQQHCLGSYLLWKMVTRWRIRLGAWILGDRYIAVMAGLWTIRDRAMRAVKQDGTVVLAECEPLAEALYEPLPGLWRMTLERIDEPAPVSGGR